MTRKSDEKQYVYVYYMSKERDSIEIPLNHVRVNSPKPIGFLEGVFVSDKELVFEDRSEIMEVPRSKMSQFEQEYLGRFIQF